MVATFYTLEELGLHTVEGARGRSKRVLKSAPSVFEINDLDTLLELEPVWNELLTKAVRPTFSQTLPWLRLFAEHFADTHRLRTFCLDEQGETTGFTVLLERAAHGIRKLTLPHVGWETLQPIGASAEKNWKVVVQHLNSELSNRHVLDMCGLSDVEGNLKQTLQSAGHRLGQRSVQHTAAVRLNKPSEPTSHWATGNSVAEQHLATQGHVHFARYRPLRQSGASPQLPSELYEHCLRVALNDEANLSKSESVLNEPARHRFLRDLFPLTWSQAAADLCLLFLDKRPIAFRFHTLAFGHLQTVWTGVDAEFREWSANVLLQRTIRDSLERQDLEIDLGPTSAEDAAHWNATLRPLHHWTVGARVTP